MQPSPKSELTREISKVTITKLEDLGLSLSPENYAVWYYHLANANPDLSKALMVIEAQGKTFDKARDKEGRILYQ